MKKIWELFKKNKSSTVREQYVSTEKKKHISVNEESVFDVNNLHLWYNFESNNELLALKNLSITIPKNKITALIGPSGCGKSTFLRTLNRMNDLVEGCNITGDVVFEGKDIYKKIDVVNLRKKVGMVFQKPNPFPMSIFENVAYGPRCQGLKDKEKLRSIVEDALKGAALWDEVKDKLDDPGIGLSGGQQQRLCIARTIAMQPDVILMDEPTSALDPISTIKVEELIKKLSKKYSIVIVTHSMQQASRLSDYTAFFYLGEIIEFNTTRNIFTNPTIRRTKDYINGRVG